MRKRVMTKLYVGLMAVVLATNKGLKFVDLSANQICGVYYDFALSRCAASHCN